MLNKFFVIVNFKQEGNTTSTCTNNCKGRTKITETKKRFGKESG